ncbi:MAG: hypothetical protein A2934_00590 [Candidatus Sungbacteria bacterium RIFCSPLOWO2_01_FULL_47_10]|uniref:Adenine DNA glycosylase n=1 Tax=Candidatus Sungbacteria bacterium RIFCSPLOWO2_01_FULL_47_10 TaxID=1802276 RepID=A0A1G2L5P8_9BACT|nr:MAG: hypothetical protein A2934_00590 [Candidatus Sungbacteria bacterium RIFCSPLOWO2_01_FULL_47_10]
MSFSVEKFHKLILCWYRTHGRRGLPWRKTHNPYEILVSEIMLQQTQVERVISKYRNFLKKFPTAKKLARAGTFEVLKEWKGLGYNRRALYLKKAAEKIVNDFGGWVPKTEAELLTLPGIGQYTARAILAFSWNRPVVFIETNIRRVFIHHFFPNTKKVSDKKISAVVAQMLWKKDPRVWYWALMDYGADMAKARWDRPHRARKIPNPNKKSAHYVRQSPFVGSRRHARSKVLELLLKKKKIRFGEIRKFFQSDAVLKKYASQKILFEIVCSLERDGFIAKNGSAWSAR